jgi:hypothetical protein
MAWGILTEKAGGYKTGEDFNSEGECGKATQTVRSKNSESV